MGLTTANVAALIALQKMSDNGILPRQSSWRQMHVPCRHTCVDGVDRQHVDQGIRFLETGPEFS